MTSAHDACCHAAGTRAAELIREACGGDWPVTLAACRAVAARFGAALRLCDPEDIPYAHLRNHVIYVPDTGGEAWMVQQAVHEIAEAALRWDGEPPYVIPQPTGEEHHQCACVAETAFMQAAENRSVQHAL